MKYIAIGGLFYLSSRYSFLAEICAMFFIVLGGFRLLKMIRIKLERKNKKKLSFGKSIQIERLKQK